MRSTSSPPNPASVGASGSLRRPVLLVQIGVLLLMLPTVLGYAQHAQPPATDSTCCALPEHYVPEDPRFWPIMQVRLVIHIITKPEDNDIYPDSSAAFSLMWGFIDQTNQTMAQLAPMRLPTSSPHIPDSRVRFHFGTDMLLFHPRDDWDGSELHGVGQRANRARTYYQELVQQNSNCPHPDSAIHIFLMERPNSADQKVHGIASGLADHRWVIIFDTWDALQKKKWPAYIFAHELGHSLGLRHTTHKKYPLDDGCDDTPTYPINKDCWNGDSCSNNMMDYNTYSNALTACQLGIIQHALAGKRGTLTQAIIPHWCLPAHPHHSIHIPADTTLVWCGERKLAGDLHVQAGATLRLRCPVHLPQGGRVIVHTGARLILEQQGALVNHCAGGQWEGVYLRRKWGTRAGAFRNETGADADKVLVNVARTRPRYFRKRP